MEIDIHSDSKKRVIFPASHPARLLLSFTLTQEALSALMVISDMKATVLKCMSQLLECLFSIHHRKLTKGLMIEYAKKR